MDNNLHQLAFYFLFVLNQVKLMHWMTPSYAEHQALDQLYTKLSVSVDRFMEVYQGKTQSRIIIPSGQDELENYIRLRNEQPTKFLQRVVNFLNDSEMIHTTDNDLLNIRDEMVADINQTLYLLTFQ